MALFFQKKKKNTYIPQLSETCLSSIVKLTHLTSGIGQAVDKLPDGLLMHFNSLSINLTLAFEVAVSYP